MLAILRPTRCSRLAMASAALFMGAAPAAFAQVGGRTWYPLDASPPGTAAQVIVDVPGTSPTLTTFDVVIHGFWVTPRTGPDGHAYSQLDVPGMQRLSILGAPELPVVRAPIAVVTGVPAVQFVNEVAPNGSVSFHLHLWPQPVPATEDSSGTPEVFTLDPAVYASSQAYPGTQASAGPIGGALGSLRASTLECHPLRWVPSRDSLVVQAVTRWTFAHSGATLASSPITRDRNRIAAAMYLNWSEVNQVLPINAATYQGEFLFVYPSAYTASVKPLASQKSIRGYNVTQITTESIGSVTCTSVRNAILNWYNATPSTHDHYCILVGDISDIPFCPEPGGTDPDTDDLYGSADASSPERDIFMGRLPVGSATDVKNQVKKIIDYEDHPPGPLYYGNVLLVARKPDFTNPDGNYPAQQDSVRLMSYTVKPSFLTYYGSQAGKTNAGLTTLLNSGYGITSYRGHGSTNEWWTWDGVSSCGGDPGECYTNTNVSALANGSLTTIVWSIACDNSDLRDPSCMGREWLVKYPGGANAHYGSSRPSSTQDNDTLEDSLFAAVWRYGLTKLGAATTFAEDKSIGWDYGWAIPNAWTYTLFGDPEMDVRRDKPPSWTIVSPYIIALMGTGSMPLDVRVLDAQGAPVPGALVSLWKPGALAGSEVATNLYTANDGWAHLRVNPQTPGMLYYAVRDSVGHSLTDSIAVVPPGAVPLGAAAPLELRASPSVTHGATRLRFGRPLLAPASVRIFDLFGRPVTTLDVTKGASEVEWTGADAAGHAVRSGLYFARLAGADGLVARVVVLR